MNRKDPENPPLDGRHLPLPLHGQVPSPILSPETGTLHDPCPCKVWAESERAPFANWLLDSPPAEDSRHRW
ncbi:hypothetical protein [Geomonas sp.]|uniref:hypothetical protein n=1 Tax=Geomonas sp. TaxID=2651584 RepID=UPI002B4669B2|nr:hypothetical protein [Geomonas sp.]HJV37147.1 hypothetical protein [Geomonas sp.]